MSVLKKVKDSVTGWEKSWFGGYRNIIWDYPSISIAKSIDLESANTADFKSLGFYASEKLLKIFLFKVNEINKIDLLLERATIELVDHGFSGYSTMKRVLKIDSDAIKQCVTQIASAGDEISPLLTHYADSIAESRILILIPDDPGGSKGSKGSGEDDSEEGEEGEKSKRTAYDEIKAHAKEQLGISSKYKPYSTEDRLASYGVKPKWITETDANEACVYTDEQTRIADNLVKMLDISWDPEVEKLMSLRAGKLDVSKIAEVPAGNLSVYYKTEEDMTTKPFSVCILCDESGSMGGWGEVSPATRHKDRIHVQNDTVRALYKAFSQIMPEEKIFIYGHGGDSSPEIFTYCDPYQPNFEARINNLFEKRELQNNYDGPVVEAIHERIRSLTDDRIIFIHLSDGYPEGKSYGGTRDMNDFRRIIEKCRRDDFVCLGVGIERIMDGEIYNYSTDVYSLGDLPKNVSMLINKVVKTEFQ